MFLLCRIREALCANDTIKFFLRLLLHVGIQRHRQYECVQRGSGRLASAKDYSVRLSV